MARQRKRKNSKAKDPFRAFYNDLPHEMQARMREYWRNTKRIQRNTHRVNKYSPRLSSRGSKNWRVEEKEKKKR